MKAKTTNQIFKQLTQHINNAVQIQEPEAPEVQEPQLPEIAPETMQKFEALLNLEKIMPDDLVVLTPEERKVFFAYLGKVLLEKKDTALDIFIEQTNPITSCGAKEYVRERNQIMINEAVASFVGQYGRMPSKVEIAARCGISRLTVQRHLKEFNGSDDFKAKLEEYQHMKTTVIEKVMQAAVNGDIKAAKYFIETVDKLSGLETKATVINQQNNFIQINGVQLNLPDLSAEKLKLIEEIIELPLVVKNE